MELKPFICASEVLLIAITIWGINIAGKFWADSRKVIIKLVRQHSWICYWYSIYFQRCRRFFHRFSRSKFIDSLPGLFRIARILVKTILIIGLLSLFTISRCFLKSEQSFESFDLLALIFRISRSCIQFLSADVDCKTVGFFLKISKEIGKAWRKSLTREAREPHTPYARVRREYF